MKKCQRRPFAETHRKSPVVVVVRLVIPVPFAIVEIEVGSIGTACLLTSSESLPPPDAHPRRVGRPASICLMGEGDPNGLPRLAPFAWAFALGAQILSHTLFPRTFQPPFRLPAYVRYMVNGCFKRIETVECLDLLADADDNFEFLDCHPQFFEGLFFIDLVIRPDNQFDHCSGRITKV